MDLTRTPARPYAGNPLPLPPRPHLRKQIIFNEDATAAYPSPPTSPRSPVRPEPSHTRDRSPPDPMGSQESFTLTGYNPEYHTLYRGNRHHQFPPSAESSRSSSPVTPPSRHPENVAISSFKSMISSPVSVHFSTNSHLAPVENIRGLQELDEYVMVRTSSSSLLSLRSHTRSSAVHTLDTRTPSNMSFASLSSQASSYGSILSEQYLPPPPPPTSPALLSPRRTNQTRPASSRSYEPATGPFLRPPADPVPRRPSTAEGVFSSLRQRVQSKSSSHPPKSSSTLSKSTSTFGIASRAPPKASALVPPAANAIPKVVPSSKEHPGGPFDERSIPTTTELMEASEKWVISQEGKTVRFGTLFLGGKTVVCFIRHFWCPLCEDYMFSISRTVPPTLFKDHGVRLVVISNGSYKMIKSYRQIFQTPFEVYTDPTLELYRCLGMTLRTLDGGSESEKGNYVRHGLMGGIGMVVVNALKVGMPVWEKGGDIPQLGGEFILGPGMQCTWAHRMRNTRAHVPILKVLQAAGVDMVGRPEPRMSIAGVQLDEEEEKDWMRRRKRSLERLQERKAFRRKNGEDNCGEGVSCAAESITQAQEEARVRQSFAFKKRERRGSMDSDATVTGTTTSHDSGDSASIYSTATGSSSVLLRPIPAIRQFFHEDKSFLNDEPTSDDGFYTNSESHSEALSSLPGRRSKTFQVLGFGYCHNNTPALSSASHGSSEYYHGSTDNGANIFDDCGGLDFSYEGTSLDVGERPLRAYSKAHAVLGIESQEMFSPSGAPLGHARVASIVPAVPPSSWRNGRISAGSKGSSIRFAGLSVRTK